MDLKFERFSTVIRIISIGLISLFVIVFYFFIPFGYKLKPAEGMEIYQYQTINKSDLVLYKLKLLSPFDKGFPVIDDYTINYGDYNDLTTEEYCKKYNTSNQGSIGEQVIMSDSEGNITFTVNKRSVVQKLDVIKATKAELGYAGSSNTGDVLDLDKIYLDVDYENGKQMQYSINQFEIVDSDDLVLKRGFNNFTVSYAGEIFLLSVLCEV